MNKEEVKTGFNIALEHNKLTMLGDVKKIINAYSSKVIAEFTGLDEIYIDRLKAKQERFSSISLDDYCKLMSMTAVPDWYYLEPEKDKEYGPEVQDEDCQKGLNEEQNKPNTDYARIYADAAEEAKTKLFGRKMLPNTMTFEEMKKCLEENGWADEFDFDGDEKSDSMRLRVFLYRKLTDITKEIYQARKDKQEKKDTQPKHKDRSDYKSELADIQELFDKLFGKGNVFFTKF